MNCDHTLTPDEKARWIGGTSKIVLHLMGTLETTSLPARKTYGTTMALINDYSDCQDITVSGTNLALYFFTNLKTKLSEY